MLLVTLALEQIANKASVEETLPTEPDRTVLLLNSDVLAGRELLRFSAWPKETPSLQYGLEKTYPPQSG